MDPFTAVSKQQSSLPIIWTLLSRKEHHFFLSCLTSSKQASAANAFPGSDTDVLLHMWTANDIDQRARLVFIEQAEAGLHFPLVCPKVYSRLSSEKQLPFQPFSVSA